MKDLILASIFFGLLGLTGIGVSIWMLITDQATNSVDNLFLTLVGLLFAIIGFGYNAWFLRTLRERWRHTQRESSSRPASHQRSFQKRLAKVA